ncbi:hypothetical protein BA059_27095 [Mycolicibacterium sp. (ex Dasyatis americana)]|nr:hypothetical protein BA059_27095 [Mycolicibacterium sp. (ex Dasyatis americana)]
MKAVRYYGVGDIRIEHLPDPKAGTGQVVIRVAHNGICGTDLHEYFAAPTLIPTSAHPLTGVSVPITLGHEFAGTVAEVGPDVTRCAVGDRVTVRPTLSCGACVACRGKAFNLCRKLALSGLSATSGGLSEYAVVDADQIHVLPDEVSLELGALVEPMAVAYHAVRKSGAGPGDAVVVSGLGPIGIGMWFALRSLGVTKVVLSDPAESRRARAAALGGNHVIDPTVDDLAALVGDLSDGDGAAAVLDAAGVGAAVLGGLQVLAPAGRVVVVGLHESAFSLQPLGVVLGELSITGSAVYLDDDFTSVIQAMAAGNYSTEGWVDHAPIDGITGALDDLRKGRGTKILIDV